MISISSDTSEVLLLDCPKSTRPHNGCSGEESKELTDPLARRREEAMPLLIATDKQQYQRPASLLPKKVRSLISRSGVSELGWYDFHASPCQSKKSFCKDALLNFGICSKRKILKKIFMRLNRGINPDEWNSYRLIQGDGHAAADGKGCMAIRFTGSNLVVLKQPAGLHTEPAHFNSVIGIHFRKTSSCPAQFLAIGEYLIWDDRCFTAMNAEKFHLIYRHTA